MTVTYHRYIHAGGTVSSHVVILGTSLNGIGSQDWVIREISIGEDSKSRETWRDSLGSADRRA
jgi:hypothetical protein